MARDVFISQNFLYLLFNNIVNKKKCSKYNVYILKEISPEYSFEGLMLRLKL